MFDKADILARLQKGDKIEDIANELSTALNDAEADYKAIQEKEKTEFEEARVNGLKLEAAASILGGLADYCTAVGKEDLVEEIKKITVGQVVDLLDQSLDLVVMLNELKNLEFEFPSRAKKSTSADLALAEFLKTLS